jgi:1,2-diacylglycerol 3-alpha-glucosyltransferase
MRIAQFTESYRPVINGAAVAVQLLDEELSQRHHVEVFAPRFPGHKDDRRVRRFPSYFWPGHRDYPLALPFSPSIRTSFRKAGFDVVHTHSPFALGQTGLRWARSQWIPVVTTYHTLYVEYAHYAGIAPPELTRRYLRELSRRYCNAVDAVVVPTAPIRDVLREYGVTRPVHVIPTGLRLRAPQPPDREFPRRAFGIPEDAPLVLYAGRLAREKNLELLFGGFARVARALPEARLLICGSGPAEGEARALAAATGAGDRIVFAGFVPTDRMPAVYAAADVFAFASLTDTQGLVLTEAKAAGLPAVSVDAYGPGAVVKHGVDGFLTPNDPEAFAEGLLTLLRNPDLAARMREAAVQEARRFSIEATAQAYEAVYDEVRECAGARVCG